MRKTKTVSYEVCDKCGAESERLPVHIEQQYTFENGHNGDEVTTEKTVATFCLPCAKVSLMSSCRVEWHS